MVGSTSHELRTPLNALMILMGLVKMNPRLPERKRIEYIE
jgi:signal transduction histidine kinase